MLKAVDWSGGRDGHVILIDQSQLPDRHALLELREPAELIDAIRALKVRGAPAIGVAAAYGVCLAGRHLEGLEEVRAAVEQASQRLRAARPTAVNLAHMIDRMLAVARASPAANGLVLRDRLLAEAHAIHAEDAELCRRIGEAGAELVADGCRLLTHCNAGALATAGEGTALAVLYAAQRRGRRFSVLADETRPLLQGARLTAWELARADIPVTVICDGAAASFFARGEVDLVITGADRIAANGDAANKIGTYGVACLARQHGVPFYIAAPSTTFDLSLASGEQIPIEERAPEEVWGAAAGTPWPPGVSIRNPAFDVTPHALIAGWITERGILRPPFAELAAAGAASGPRGARS